MECINETINVWTRNELIYYYYTKFRTSIQKYIDTTFEANEIIDNMWLGEISSSRNREELKKRGIEMILSAVLGCTAAYPFDFNYERANLRDIENEDIIEDFHRLLPIIHETLENGKGILIHCMKGRSRSASFVAAYLIKYKDMTTEQALEFAKSKRSQVAPNPSYIRQLKQFEYELREEQRRDLLIKKNL